MGKYDSNIARQNFEALSKNPYPGRGIVVGVDETGESMIQIYWIMGRSENSRNRIFSADKSFLGRIFTEPVDASKVTDLSLTIYNAMDEAHGQCIVSNGNQTDTVTEQLKSRKTLGLAYMLREWKYEPDSPNFTPRITAISSFGIDGKSDPQVSFLTLKKCANNDSCQQIGQMHFSIQKGFGFCVTTYTGDGNPLPSFDGNPLLMPLTGNSEAIAQTYWRALNEENRVSLVVKTIPRSSPTTVRIINKFSKIA